MALKKFYLGSQGPFYYDDNIGGIVVAQLIFFKGRYAVAWSQWDRAKKKQALYIAVSD